MLGLVGLPICSLFRRKQHNCIWSIDGINSWFDGSLWGLWIFPTIKRKFIAEKTLQKHYSYIHSNTMSDKLDGGKCLTPSNQKSRYINNWSEMIHLPFEVLDFISLCIYVAFTLCTFSFNLLLNVPATGISSTNHNLPIFPRFSFACLFTNTDESKKSYIIISPYSIYNLGTILDISCVYNVTCPIYNPLTLHDWIQIMS